MVTEFSGHTPAIITTPSGRRAQVTCECRWGWAGTGTATVAALAWAMHVADVDRREKERANH